VSVEVVLYTAPGCHLCDRARAVLRAEQAALGFALREVDITGDEELERRHRVFIPVVEIGGERAFVYEVQPAALRSRLAAAGK
jgi:glutaredoxin